MILLYIYAGVSLLAFILTWSIAVQATHIFRERYPGMKAPKSYLSSWITVLVKTFVVSILPIFNIFYLLTLVTKTDELIESSIHKLYLKCLSNQDSGDVKD